MYLFLKMFIRLLSICTIGNVSKSLASYSEAYFNFISLDNWPCQAKPKLVNINSKQPLYCLVTVSVNKCGGSFNTIDDPCAWVCVPNKVKNMNVKVFYFMSRVTETRYLIQHESCECRPTINQK